MTTLLVLVASNKAFKEQDYQVESRVKTSNETFEPTRIIQLITSLIYDLISSHINIRNSGILFNFRHYCFQISIFCRLN